MDKIDPHRYEEKYKAWKSSGYPLEDISQMNKTLIIEYLQDMEMGHNIGSQKGPRGYARLCNLKQRMGFMTRKLQELYKKDLPDLAEREIILFFNEMRKGSIKSRTGKNYKSTADYVWVFKAFWHWYMRKSKKEGMTIQDITVDLDTSLVQEPGFVYLSETEMKKFLDTCLFDYKVMGYFCYDSGIRSPTELMNVRYSDLEWDEREKIYVLTIRDEVSKTFGRKIKLIFCSEVVKQYINQKGLSGDDLVFSIKPSSVIKYFKRHIVKTYGEEKAASKTKGGKELGKFSLYDFRHNSACYWIARYKNESGLKYRFGWKKNSMIYYYTKMLGHKDTITKDDMVIDVTKSELEKELATERKSRQVLEEDLTFVKDKLKELEDAGNERMKADRILCLVLEQLYQDHPSEITKAIQKMGIEEKIKNIEIKN
jgi:integrase